MRARQQSDARSSRLTWQKQASMPRSRNSSGPCLVVRHEQHRARKALKCRRQALHTLKGVGVVASELAR